MAILSLNIPSNASHGGYYSSYAKVFLYKEKISRFKVLIIYRENKGSQTRY